MYISMIHVVFVTCCLKPYSIQCAHFSDQNGQNSGFASQEHQCTMYEVGISTVQKQNRCMAGMKRR